MAAAAGWTLAHDHGFELAATVLSVAAPLLVYCKHLQLSLARKAGDDSSDSDGGSDSDEARGEDVEVTNWAEKTSGMLSVAAPQAGFTTGADPGVVPAPE